MNTNKQRNKPLVTYLLLGVDLSCLNRLKNVSKHVELGLLNNLKLALSQRAEYQGAWVKWESFFSRIFNPTLFFYLDHLILHLELHFRAWRCGGLEWLSPGHTLGMPGSIYARFIIVSNTCHTAPCYLNGYKFMFEYVYCGLRIIHLNFILQVTLEIRFHLPISHHSFHLQGTWLCFDFVGLKPSFVNCYVHSILTYCQTLFLAHSQCFQS